MGGQLSVINTQSYLVGAMHKCRGFQVEVFKQETDVVRVAPDNLQETLLMHLMLYRGTNASTPLPALSLCPRFQLKRDH